MTDWNRPQNPNGAEYLTDAFDSAQAPQTFPWAKPVITTGIVIRKYNLSLDIP